jgi:hypothetical protein
LKLLLATAVLVCHPAAASACPEWLRRNRGKWIAAGTAATAGIVVLSALFNWWAQSFILPGRTQSVIYFLFLIGWFLTTFAVGTSSVLSMWSPRPVWAVLAVCWAVSLDQGTNFRSARDDLRSGRAGAFSWRVKERDRLIREAVAAGNLNPAVPPIGNSPSCFDFCDIFDEPEKSPFGFINTHYCQYYGLKSIRLRHDTPTGGLATASGKVGGENR